MKSQDISKISYDICDFIQKLVFRFLYQTTKKIPQKTSTMCLEKVAAAGVNFTNILRAAFTHADPKSAKKTVKSSIFFVLSGSKRVKAAHKHIDEINPCCRWWWCQMTLNREQKDIDQTVKWRRYGKESLHTQPHIHTHTHMYKQQNRIKKDSRANLRRHSFFEKHFE